jgi:hypothetical protein
LVVYNLTAVGGDGPEEGIVDRRLHHHLIARFTKSLNKEVYGVDDAVGSEYPFRFNGPAVTADHPVHYGVVVKNKIPGIAVNTVVSSAPERLVDLRGRAELHVGYPHGEAVFRRDPVPYLHTVPLEALGIPPVDDGIEIVAHRCFYSSVAGNAISGRVERKWKVAGGKWKRG